ncbi:MAG: anthrone oxygenase family protein [Bacteroidota bacterium]
MKRNLALLAIIGCSAYFGNIINIGFTHAVAWQAQDPMIFMEGFGPTFLLLLPTVAFTLLPGFIGIIASIYQNKTNPAAKQKWRIALYLTLISLAITSIFHLPTNLAFMDQSYTAAEAASKLQWWVILHWVRIALALLASIYTLLAFQISVKSERV